jgi:hypothetical protein
MKTFRIVLGILAIIPIALLADNILFHATQYTEHWLRTLVFFVFGIPILILNLWAWTYPHIIEVYFFGKKEDDI